MAQQGSPPRRSDRMPAGRRRRAERPDYPGDTDRPGWDHSGRDDSPGWDDRAAPGGDAGWDDRAAPGGDAGWDDRAAPDDDPGAGYRSVVQSRSRSDSRRLRGPNRSGGDPRARGGSRSSGGSGSSGGSRYSSGSRSSLDAFNDDTDQDLPPWAGLAIYPAGPGRKERRPPAEQAAQADQADQADQAPGRGGRLRGRAAATRARRSKRRLYALGGLAVILILVVLGVTGNLPFLNSSAKPSNDGLVTSFQPGDIRSAPNACQAISPATLGQYLPGKRARAVIQSGRSESQCTWTLDARPVYRVLEVTTQAFAPNLLSTGNGSATFSAMDAYDAALLVMQNPPKAAHRPKAQLGAPGGLGNAAFIALQVWHTGGNTTDFVTVVARERNALLTVTLQGLDHAAGGGYGPVSVTTLQAGALAIAHQVMAGIR